MVFATPLLQLSNLALDASVCCMASTREGFQCKNRIASSKLRKAVLNAKALITLDINDPINLPLYIAAASTLLCTKAKQHQQEAQQIVESWKADIKTRCATASTGRSWMGLLGTVLSTIVFSGGHYVARVANKLSQWLGLNSFVNSLLGNLDALASSLWSQNSSRTETLDSLPSSKTGNCDGNEPEIVQPRSAQPLPRFFSDEASSKTALEEQASYVVDATITRKGPKLNFQPWVAAGPCRSNSTRPQKLEKGGASSAGVDVVLPYSANDLIQRRKRVTTRGGEVAPGWSPGSPPRVSKTTRLRQNLATRSCTHAEGGARPYFGDGEPLFSYYRLRRRTLHDVHRDIVAKIMQPLSPRDKLAGHIYALGGPEYPDHLKIGATSNSVEIRRNRISRTCRSIMTLVGDSGPGLIPNVFRVEALVQLELALWRKWTRRCRSCSQRHKEFFGVDEMIALASVQRWTNFVKKRPYVTGASSTIKGVWAVHMSDHLQSPFNDEDLMALARIWGRWIDDGPHDAILPRPGCAGINMAATTAMSICVA